MKSKVGGEGKSKCLCSLVSLTGCSPNSNFGDCITCLVEKVCMTVLVALN